MPRGMEHQDRYNAIDLCAMSAHFCLERQATLGMSVYITLAERHAGQVNMHSALTTQGR